MQTKTFTLLVTVRDDGSAAVFNPIILAAAVKGALETGCRFVLSSTEVEKLKGDPLIRATIGEHRLTPAVSAEVDAFEGDATHLLCCRREDQSSLRKTRRLHANLRAA